MKKNTEIAKPALPFTLLAEVIVVLFFRRLWKRTSASMQSSPIAAPEVGAQPVG